MTGRRLRTAAVVAAAAIAAAPGGASAAAHPSYRPKRGARCRAGYVRESRQVRRRSHGKTVHVRQIWCVYRAPKPKPLPPPAAATTTSTSTFVSASDPQTNGTSSWFTVTGSIYYGGGSELLGQPLTYTILDATTGQQVGSFSGTSNSDGQCSVVYGLTAESTLQTWTGQAVAPYPACSLGTVSMPAGDTAVFTGAFAGNAKFAASTSGEAGFY